MFKNYCRVCKKAIPAHDFFIETVRGRICSNCMLSDDSPSAEIKKVFDHKKPKREASVGEMSLNELYLQVSSL